MYCEYSFEKTNQSCSMTECHEDTLVFPVHELFMVTLAKAYKYFN